MSIINNIRIYQVGEGAFILKEFEAMGIHPDKALEYAKKDNAPEGALSSIEKAIEYYAYKAHGITKL